MDPIKSSAPAIKGLMPTASAISKSDAGGGTESIAAIAHSSEQQIGRPVREDKDKIFEELKKAIDAIQGPQKALEFSVHKDTHAVMIKVMNKETGELIREVPPEKMLDVAAKMMELAGLIVDKKI
ncbi:flagellar biosynthesis protein FlaG [Paenibacillus polymyxa]|uniref:flagellar protein FlaG n=1 Tax=Paenibacillus polymyxa TaxID=1406 RepID=UPI0010BEC04F|nr:flagellar protein FlaG [Paenibacillus polymyxa]TKH33160.1 flagellar biosynthesis protein FlaG [Paenibacillus polymyxa]